MRVEELGSEFGKLASWSREARIEEEDPEGDPSHCHAATSNYHPAAPSKSKVVNLIVGFNLKYIKLYFTLSHLFCFDLCRSKWNSWIEFSEYSCFSHVALQVRLWNWVL